MIARGAPTGTLCFSCRLHIIRQSTPVRSFVSAPATRNHASGHLNARDRSDDAGHRRSVPNDRRGAQTSNRPVMKKLNLRKRHRSGNRVLDETAEKMEGANMLGKPAYALVMKDGGKAPPRKRPADSDETGNSIGNLATKIEALLASQQHRPTLQEVRLDIDKLHPSTEKVLSAKDFEKLKTILMSGFLSSQLEEYIAWSKARAELSAPEQPVTHASDHPEFPWVTEIIPWVPLQAEPLATEHLLHGYVTESTTTKEALTIRLMRECWGLSIAELETQLGEMRVKLRDDEFVLLMRGTQRFMKSIGALWLEPGERIEAIQDQKTLLLVAKKTKVELFLRELEDILQNVKTKTFPLRLVLPEVPDDTLLEELGRLTNSNLRRSHTLRRLHVSWIELKSRAARGFKGLEDMAHIVMRLLLTASGSQQRVTQVLVSSFEGRDSKGRLIVDSACREKLGWKDRLTKWARYVFPLAPEEESAGPSLPIEKFKLPFEPLILPEHLKENIEFFPDSHFPAHPVKWSNASKTSTVAHFGHVLHPYQPNNSETALSDLLLSTQRRVFSPITPSAIHLAQLEATDSDTAPIIGTKFTLLLRFWPSPSTNPATDNSVPGGKKSAHAGDTPPAPVLELRLAMSDDEVQGVEGLRAIRQIHHTDALLPSSPVDVRFTQTQYEELQAPDRAALALWQPITNFLEPARLDVKNGKLEMPPRQRFPIPIRLITADPSAWGDSSSLPDELQGEDPDELVSISYEFVGLELHRSATLPFDGHHQLTYTSIEAGQGGGRRAEVTLEPLEMTPPASSPSPSSSTNPGDTSTSSADTSSTNTSSSSSSSSSPPDVVDNYLLQQKFLEACSEFIANESLWSGTER